MEMKTTMMFHNSSPPLGRTMAYLFCIVLSIAMIWYLLLGIFYCSTCTEKPLAYAFIPAFILMIAYAGFGIFKILFPAKAESCPICTLISRK